MQTKIKDTKLKPLIPILREKKRFFKIHIKSEKKFSFSEISENLTDELLMLIGAIDYGKSGIWILRDKFDYENQIIILKSSLSSKNKVAASISIIQKLGNSKTKLEIKKISGTLKSLQ